MKERPILFSAPMVRAILAGTKTQTRRVVKPRKDPDYGCELSPGEIAGDEHAARLCPYGQPGDRLWVRETFAKIDGQTQPWIETDYRATYTHGDRLGDTLGLKKRWTPAIHMPRAASRISLEITAVRVERLQDISEAAAKAEGVHRNIDGLWSGGVWKHLAQPNRYGDPCNAFCDLWASINGGESWDANPWVWVVEFKRVQQP